MIPLETTILYAVDSYPNRYWTLQRNTTEWHIFIRELTVSGNAMAKLMLEALPSPALVPPSPFELEPHRTGASPKFAQGVLPESAAAGHDHRILVEKLEGLRVAEAEAESGAG